MKAILVILLCMTSLCGMSQITSNSSLEKNDEASSLLRLIKGSSDRKRTLSNEYIEVRYMNGCISVNSDVTVEIQTLNIKNVYTGELVFTSFIMLGEFVMVQLDGGQYEITIECVDGSLFYGVMSI